MKVTPIPLKKRIGLELFSRLRDSIVRQHPLQYLVWECTLRCNLSCVHCGSDCRRGVRSTRVPLGTKTIPYQNTNPWVGDCRKIPQSPDMPLADFIKTIQSIMPYVEPNKTMIVLTGGEPLMRNDLAQCGQALYDRGFPWGMVTNGLLLNKKRYMMLEQAGLRSITVSLDGFEESHNRMRGSGKSFKNALNAIQIIAQPKFDVVFDVVTCVNQWNFNELAKLKELLIETGVKAWRLFTVFPIGRAANNKSLQLDAVQFKQLFDFIHDTRKEGRIKADYGCEGFLGNYETEVRDSFFFCRAGITIGSVLADGSISACPNLRSNFIQGNIYHDDFMDVWNNRYQAFRDRSWAKQGECTACNYFKYCKGNGMHLHDENGNLLFCHFKRLKEVES